MDTQQVIDDLQRMAQRVVHSAEIEPYLRGDIFHKILDLIGFIVKQDELAG